MLHGYNNPTLVLLAAGQARGTYSLAPGVTTIGRAVENIIVLDDPSVSRRHAEIEVGPDRVTARDIKSRNGIFINGVLRDTAPLQPGDRLHIGKVELQFAAGFVRVVTPPVINREVPASLEETRQTRLPFPDQRTDRHLKALYQICFESAGEEERDGAEQRLLELLLDALRSKVAHYYDAGGRLAFSAVAEKVRLVPKFAPYLLKKFQQLPESAAYLPNDLARFQQKLGDWHFLVAPLRRPTDRAEEPVPLVVLLRPSDWQPFSVEDRTFVNAAARLWQRGRPSERSENENKIKSSAQAGANTSGLLGESVAMQALRTRLDRIAATKATVLIAGETGSGKEVVAKYIHEHSPRAKGPYIKLNCAAIPGALMESELFGHVKGAFTDARGDHQGKFQQANEGTIFLDEIGELPLQVQSKLLRVLENGEVERIGGEDSEKVDVRIIAATNRDLRGEVKKGDFREDLLFRLEVATVAVPPLRAHLDDIPALANHFLRSFCSENEMEREFAGDALNALKKHLWPGNVRELRNVVQRAAIESGHAAISAADVANILF